MGFDVNTLTDGQRLVYDLFPAIQADAAYWQFRIADLFAFCQVESGFRPRAYRFEPRLNEASYGLMQVLPSTARQFGFTGEPESLYDPLTNLRYGTRFAEWGWNQLYHKLGTYPPTARWVAGYNEGYGAAARGEPDPAYWAVWKAARDHWQQRFFR